MIELGADADAPELGLGSFGDDSTTPEDRVKIYLSEWLEDHGATVFWEKSPSYGRHTFRSEGAADKPDLLAMFETPTADTETTVVAIEVKTGDGGGPLHDAAVQLPRYWIAHEAGRDHYHVGGSQFSPDAFVLATAFSPQGRLFGNTKYRDRVQTRDDMGDGHLRAVDRGWLPPAEYGCSATLTRVMWRQIREAGVDSRTGIGSIYSTTLEADDPAEAGIGSPAICHYTPDRGRQHWETLGNGEADQQ